MSIVGGSQSLSEGERAFLQLRVARFGLAAGGVFGGFWLFRVVVAASDGQPDLLLTDASMTFHLLGAACFVAIWAACRRGERSATAIRMVEAIGLIAGATLLVLMASSIAHIGRPDFILLLSLTAALSLRAIYVPSSGRRTLLLALIVGIEVVVSTYLLFLNIELDKWAIIEPQLAELLPRQAAFGLALNATAWWTVTMFTTSAASRVIYGLRRNVRDAKQLGQYRLLAKLGEGGMGMVFRAEHALLRRPTAIKLLLPEKAGEHSIQRFEREVRMQARLRHPNTVRIFDYGHTPDGLFYCAMELIDGATLSDIVHATGPLDLPRALSALDQVAGALVEAHGSGLIHRDIKPGNIMLFLPHHYGGVKETAKVLDFGLVKEVAAQGHELTQQGALTGTPQYMAPEVIRDPSAADGRSDIYALGCVGFFMLTGEHVFNGESVMDICVKHLHDVPDMVSARLGRPLSEDIDELINSCLNKDPQLRPKNARTLQKRIRACAGSGDFNEHDALEWWEEHAVLFQQDGEQHDRFLTINLQRARGTESA